METKRRTRKRAFTQVKLRPKPAPEHCSCWKDWPTCILTVQGTFFNIWHMRVLVKLTWAKDCFQRDDNKLPSRLILPLALIQKLCYSARRRGASASGCGCGEIGRRTRFRFWRRKAWGFKSLHPHQHDFLPSM